MKNYEKAAIGVGIGALGLAAYQAHKTKQAADAVEATDPGRNPVTAAVDLSKSMVGSTYNWLQQRYDDATGYVKGRSEEVVNLMSATPRIPLYSLKRISDYAFKATEAGTKYVWSHIGVHAASGKEKLEQLTNKPFTLMGADVTTSVNKRYIPNFVSTIANAISGLNSKREHLTNKTSFLSRMKSKLGF